MMDGMRRPEPPNPVAAAMEPVIAEILSDQERDHCDSGVDRYREETVTASQIVGWCGKAQRKERQYHVLTPESIGERSEIRTPIVIAPHHECENQALKGRDYDHDGQRKSEDADDDGHIHLRWGRGILRRPVRKGCGSPRSILTTICDFAISKSNSDGIGSLAEFEWRLINSSTGLPIPKSARGPTVPSAFLPNARA